MRQNFSRTHVMPDFEEVDFSRKKFVNDEVCSIIEEHSSRRLKGS